MLFIGRWVGRSLVPMLLFSGSRLHAQWQSNTGPSGAALGAVVGGDVERYLRALIAAGVVKPAAWGTRPYGPDELRAMLLDTSVNAHPWKAQMANAVRSRASIAAMVFSGANSGFAWGANDGAMWQGRGFNAAVGFAARFSWGPMTAVAAPVAYAAQNSDFPTQTPLSSPVFQYSNALYSTIVDLPQRMGEASYRRVDPGESTLRIRTRGVEAGVSTASLGWGTGESFPAIFGPNAGGFPHLFVGTRANGVRVPFLGRVSTRYILGSLAQSEFSNVRGSTKFLDRDQSGTRRIGVGITASYLPAFLTDLELGASRFYHSPYRDASRRWEAWSKPFEGIFKKGFDGRSGGPDDIGGDTDNQIASFFARWVFPRRGVEMNVELLREDHNWDSRDLAQEPENNGAVLASIRAVTKRSASNLSLLSLEYFDGDIRQIAQFRAQGYLYSHGYLRQGHTQRGQLLGSPIGAGAIAGQRASWERFTPRGSLRATVQRWRTRSVLTSNPEALYLGPDSQIPNNHDWTIDGSLESTSYRHRRPLTIAGGIAYAGLLNFEKPRTNFYARINWGFF